MNERLKVYLFTVIPWAVSGAILVIGLIVLMYSNFYGLIGVVVGLSSMYNLYRLDKDRDYIDAIYAHHLKRKNEKTLE